jgi:hypothetical protein
MGACATFVMGLIVVATLFANPVAQPMERTSANSIPGMQHHTWAIR